MKKGQRRNCGEQEGPKEEVWDRKCWRGSVREEVWERKC